MHFTKGLKRIAAEPPFRLLGRFLVHRFSRDVQTRARWGVDPYPHYQFGILEGARLAKQDAQDGITVIECGVGSGRGLLSMEQHARAVEEHTGIRIAVVGFDSGAGLPAFIGDHRDHPDLWKPGNFPGDRAQIERAIDSTRTRLIIGDVRQTVAEYLAEDNHFPIGFISFDLDLYSSTKAALEVLFSHKRKMLRHTPLYFDDIDFIVNHRWAGELLAIREFNQEHEDVKIDCWYNIRADKPFPEQHIWDKMMVAHDLRAIDRHRR
jgi:hypothetical protein